MRLSTVILALFVFMLAVSPGASDESQALILKIATIAPEGTPFTKALHAASKEIERRSSGRVRLRIYPGGVMGSDSVVLRKIRFGQLQGGTFAAGGLAGVDGDYQLLAMPFLLKNYEEVDAARARYEPILTEGLKRKGLVSFGMIETGFVYMMSNRPITKIADLRKQKVWVPEGDQISRAVFEEAGIHPIPLPIPDVLTGLQTHLIDTVSASPVAAIILQWFTKVRYLTETPLLYSYGTLAISNRVWRGMDEKDQAIVREVLTRYVRKIDRQSRKDNQKALSTLRKQGIQFVNVSERDLKDMEMLAVRALDKLGAKKLFNYALLEEIRRNIQAMRK